MIDWLYSSSLLYTILIETGIIAVNFLYLFWVNSHLKQLYNRTGSAEQTMNRLRVLTQYVYIAMIALTMFSSMFLISNLADQFLGINHSFFISLVAGFFLLGLILWTNQLILHHTLKTVRGTTETRKEQTSTALRGFFFIFLPIIMMFFVMRLIEDAGNGFFSYGFGYVLVMIVFICVTNLVTPFVINKTLKTSPMAASEIKEELLLFLTAIGLEAVELYDWQAKKSKTATVFVTGLRTKRIYLADYLLENLTHEQIKAIVAHEIGHIKHHHFWKRLTIIMMFPIVIFSLGSGLDWYESSFHVIPIWLAFTIIGVALLLYTIWIYRFFSRRLEKQADEYVLGLGIDNRDYASALIQLANLNHMVTMLNKLDEQFQTHPSISRRVEWILHRANGSLEELKRRKWDEKALKIHS